MSDKKKQAVLSREDFVFTIGYDGPQAIIDGQAMRRYGSLSTQALMEKGLYRAAYASAVHSGDSKEILFVAEAYNRLTNSSIEPAAMERLFGVFPVEVSRYMVL
jgi:hypothetical protein